MRLEVTMCANNVAKCFITSLDLTHTSLKLIAQLLPPRVTFVEGCSIHVPWQYLIIGPSIWEQGHSRYFVVYTKTILVFYTNISQIVNSEFFKHYTF